MSNQETSKNLELVRPLLVFAVFLLFMGGLFAFFSYQSKVRAQRIYRQYADETKAYIERNKAPKPDGNIYTLFETANAYLNDCLSRPEAAVYNCHSEISISYVIEHAISHDLKDWSSTGFLIKEANNTNVYLLNLGGQLQPFSSPKSEELLKLMRGEVSELPWDDYTYFFSGKEVIIPVKDQTGKIIGAIVRAPAAE